MLDFLDFGLRAVEIRRCDEDHGRIVYLRSKIPETTLTTSGGDQLDSGDEGRGLNVLTASKTWWTTTS
jgi:hypothetical protein